MGHATSSHATRTNIMCMDITGTKACNRYMKTTFSQLYKIRSDMMEKPIHQCGGQGNLDDQKQNVSGSMSISLMLMNPQLSVLSVEMEDINIGHAQMLHHDLRISYSKCFMLFFIFPF